MRPDLPLRCRDLGVEHRDQRLDRSGVGCGHDLGLTEAGALERGANVRQRQPGGVSRGRCLGRCVPRRRRRRGPRTRPARRESSPAVCGAVAGVAGAFSDSVLRVRATSLIAPASVLPPAAGRSSWARVATMSARMCASPASFLAPDAPSRPRNLTACSALTAKTVHQAATIAATHGPRSLSIRPPRPQLRRRGHRRGCRSSCAAEPSRPRPRVAATWRAGAPSRHQPDAVMVLGLVTS